MYYLKVRKCQFFAIIDNLSDTFGSKVMKVGLQVAYGETFKMMQHLVTLDKGQGHSLYLKIGKYPFDNFWQYLRHYLQRTYDTWLKLKGSLQRENDMTFGDFDFLVKVTDFTGNVKNIHFLTISTTTQTLFTVKLWFLAKR